MAENEGVFDKLFDKALGVFDRFIDIEARKREQKVARDFQFIPSANAADPIGATSGGGGGFDFLSNTGAFILIGGGLLAVLLLVKR